MRVDCTYFLSDIWSWTSPKMKKITVSDLLLPMVSWLSHDMITITILSHMKYRGHKLANQLVDISVSTPSQNCNVFIIHTYGSNARSLT